MKLLTIFLRDLLGFARIFLLLFCLAVLYLELIAAPGTSFTFFGVGWTNVEVKIDGKEIE